MNHRCDVTLVGAGPVGSLLGILLRDYGLSVVLVEKDLVPYQLPRAIVMDDEIQRAIHLAGAGAGLAAVTSPVPGAEFVDVDYFSVVQVPYSALQRQNEGVLAALRRSV